MKLHGNYLYLKMGRGFILSMYTDYIFNFNLNKEQRTCFVYSKFEIRYN